MLNSEHTADHVDILDLHPAFLDALRCERLLASIFFIRVAAKEYLRQLVELVGYIHVQIAVFIGLKHVCHPRHDMVEIDLPTPVSGRECEVCCASYS